ncbi:MAG: hypothetical protein AB8F78_04400 [Saprospiraceae bacterium]
MKWWDQVKSIFNEAEQSQGSEPVLHEVLTRHKDKAEAFERWREGMICGRLLDWLANQYALFLTEPKRVDEGLDFLSTKSQKGFVIHFNDTQYSLQEAEFFQLLLRERVLTQSYRTQVADTRTYTKGGATERTDRYYLKPRPQWAHPEGPDAEMDGHTADQHDQQFGNVMIELVVRNEKPHQLRFSAATYHDRVYKDATGFGALMDIVFGKGA